MFSTLALTVTAVALLPWEASARAEGALHGVPMIVHESPTCGCCGEYVAILREYGIDVTVLETEDVTGVKTRYGVPTALWSCHTAELAGYAVEGHVPIAALERLANERPKVEGIALPGMPGGSPGMNGSQDDPFEIMAFGGQEVRLFGRY